MIAKRIACVMLSLFILAAAQGPYVANQAVTKVPNYRFQPGQEIIYQSISTQNKDQEIIGTNEETRIWVTGQNSDGSSRMVVRKTITPYQIAENGERTDHAPEIFWGLWDVFPDGRSVYNRTNEELDPQGIFITLPQNILEAGNGWVASKKNFWEKDSYALDQRSSDSLWIVKDVFWNPLVEIGRFSLTAEYHIDTDRGFPVKKEDKFIQVISGSNYETVTVTALDSIMTRDKDWMKALARDAERYFRADSQYGEALVQAERAYKKTEDLLKIAEKALNDAREQIESSDIREALDRQIAGVPDDAKDIREAAKTRADFINRAAKGWQVDDFNGIKHALKDYRKKVVIMDFWYRGCPWCVMAFPQVKQLADHYRDQPVAVLGMNKDADEADAKFVIERMGLTYTNLKAAEIAKSYGILGYPTLVIIDQKGVIRDVHIGYTPDLFEQVERSVDALLGK
jgi:thiol-disulfide isomerase/thioredoxin